MLLDSVLIQNFCGYTQSSWIYGSWSKNFIIFGVDNSSFVHVDNKNQSILILGEGPT